MTNYFFVIIKQIPSRPLKLINDRQYFDILNAVSAYCISSVAKRKIKNLLPQSTYEQADTLISETKQAYALFQYETSFDLSVDDVTELCSLAKIYIIFQLLVVIQ